MFPYRVDNPRLGPAVATVTIIVLNVLVWIGFEGMGSEASLLRALCSYGLIPAGLLGHLSPGTSIKLGEGLSCTAGSVPPWVTPLSSMFLHGGWFHIIGNMWFLWLFGRNVEDVMGPTRFTIFYVLAGLAAAAAQVLSDPASSLPMVGASGAISGVMGAYLILFPTVRVHLWLFQGIFTTQITVPAYAMLGYWFALQLLGQASALQAEGGGVAFAAHVGGFVAGVLLVTVFKNRDLLAQHKALLASESY
ncbi:MAG TPA: rhomboid family intramembrane serine protease [Methylococcaceae bacterium]|jgi:membrane associated rhomboid family serine protease|nr:rhomboid family intramembrane serine protease [Methylococcaceae bacterium]